MADKKEGVNYPINRTGVSISGDFILRGECVVGFGTILGPNCEAGSGLQIGHYCYFGYDIKMGNNVVVRDYVRMEAKITIGNNVDIYQYSNIGMGTVIEDDVYIGARVMITNTRRIQHVRGAPVIEPVKIEKGARIGVGAILLPGITIGQESLIGAGAIVTKSTEPFHVYYGNPARDQGLIPDEERIKYDK